MATQTADVIRTFENAGTPDEYGDLPVKAATKIYEGSAVGLTTGYARALVAADPFGGFCSRRSDNSAGANGDRNVKVREKGKIILDVTGVTGVTDVGSTVYASDDNTFTLTSTSNTAIGKVARFISGTRVAVYFEAAHLRSI